MEGCSRLCQNFLILYSQKFLLGEKFFLPHAVMGEIQNFLPHVNDYIEPTVIFIAWAKICSVKV